MPVHLESPEDKGEDKKRTADLSFNPHHLSVPCIVHVVCATTCPPEGEGGTYAFSVDFIVHQCGFVGAYR